MKASFEENLNSYLVLQATHNKFENFSSALIVFYGSWCKALHCSTTQVILN